MRRCCGSVEMSCFPRLIDGTSSITMMIHRHHAMPVAIFAVSTCELRLVMSLSCLNLFSFFLPLALEILKSLFRHFMAPR
jgi:hypothetical protein